MCFYLPIDFVKWMGDVDTVATRLQTWQHMDTVTSTFTTIQAARAASVTYVIATSRTKKGIYCKRSLQVYGFSGIVSGPKYKKRRKLLLSFIINILF